MIKTAVFTGNRAEYGLLHPVIRELSADSHFEVYLIISGSHLSETYGRTADEITVPGVIKTIEIDLGESIDNKKVDVISSYSKVLTYSAHELLEIRPDVMLLAGDRYETFAMAVAAFYSNIPIAHIFGGDLSQGGHLDDSVRHSITKLAHIHFTTNQDSFNRVLGLGEEPWRVFNVGSPFIDNVITGDYAKPDEIAGELGIVLDRPLIIFTQHPVTTESDLAYGQVKESLEALKELGCQTVITYPCNDAGSEDIIRAINEYTGNLQFIVRKSLGWRLYLGCLRIASCVVGNSSSGLLETPLFKVPCVNIGSRQSGRLRSENVIDAPYDRDEIRKAIIKAMSDESFRRQVKNCSNPYGEGGASVRIANILKTISLKRDILQKKMTY